jgi:hypothetical protein
VIFAGACHRTSHQLGMAGRSLRLIAFAITQRQTRVKNWFIEELLPLLEAPLRLSPG